MTVQENITTINNRIQAFEYNPKTVDNDMHSKLQKDVKELRMFIANIVEFDKGLKAGDTDLYIREFDKQFTVLQDFTKGSTDAERLKKLPSIKLGIDTGVELFFAACEKAKSNVLSKEKSQIPEAIYTYIIK